MPKKLTTGYFWTDVLIVLPKVIAVPVYSGVGDEYGTWNEWTCPHCGEKFEKVVCFNRISHCPGEKCQHLVRLCSNWDQICRDDSDESIAYIRQCIEKAKEMKDKNKLFSIVGSDDITD